MLDLDMAAARAWQNLPNRVRFVSFPCGIVRRHRLVNWGDFSSENGVFEGGMNKPLVAFAVDF
jgi:hypothetical protein